MAENAPSSNFCGKCGLHFIDSAVSAGATRPTSEAAFDARVAPEQPDAGRAIEGERKTVTARFADIKGSTGLMKDLDPEEAPVSRLRTVPVSRQVFCRQVFRKSASDTGLVLSLDGTGLSRSISARTKLLQTPKPLFGGCFTIARSPKISGYRQGFLIAESGGQSCFFATVNVHSRRLRIIPQGFRDLRLPRK